MALATTFNDIEKAVQEKLFYKLFFTEYYRNENMIINGFRMNETDFIIHMTLTVPLHLSTIIGLRETIKNIYNLFVEKNRRLENPRWTLEFPNERMFKYSFYITSTHDINNIQSRSFRNWIIS